MCVHGHTCRVKPAVHACEGVRIRTYGCVRVLHLRMLCPCCVTGFPSLLRVAIVAPLPSASRHRMPQNPVTAATHHFRDEGHMDCCAGVPRMLEGHHLPAELLEGDLGGTSHARALAELTSCRINVSLRHTAAPR